MKVVRNEGKEGIQKDKDGIRLSLLTVLKRKKVQ